MRVLDPPIARDILVIAAHPDDAESWCAGTLARSRDAGATIRLLLVTSGDKGSDDPQATAERVATLREDEALAAGQRLGLAEVAFLRHPDGDVEESRALREQLVAAIRRWRPSVLFTHDPEHPEPPYLTHRDHRIVGRVALDAVYPLARDRLSFPEHAVQGLTPHAVEQVWLFATDAPNAAVEITPGFERKLAARLAHASQTRDPDSLRATWRERAARFAASAGLPPGALAETFHVLDLR